MLCEKCQKNEATSFFRTTVNGKTDEKYLCSECAEQSGMSAMTEIFTDPIFDNLFLNPLRLRPVSAKKCPECGSGIGEILSSGRVGCEKCYETFEKELRPVIMQTQGSVKHLALSAEDNEKRAEELRQEMKKAIEAEDFEKAAKLRDEIRGLEA